MATTPTATATIRPVWLPAAGPESVAGGVVAALVRDPAKAAATGEKGSVLTLLATPALWPIFAMMFVCYAPAAGLRGLWLGPYFTDVYGLDRPGVGQVSLWMGLAMVAGSFLYGPLDRWLGTRKWVIFGGNALMLACMAGLAYAPDAGVVWATLMFMGVGFFGASFAVVMAHGRAFLPAHLTGRGVALINLCGIGSAGIMQVLTGRLHGAMQPAEGVMNSAPPATPYFALFMFYCAFVGIGLLIYLLSKDRTD